jgi:hypothetical protein
MTMPNVFVPDVWLFVERCSCVTGIGRAVIVLLLHSTVGGAGLTAHPPPGHSMAAAALKTETT